MSVFPDWEKYAVKQKRPKTGCIPTGYEMILRASHAGDIDFDTFQDDFDLDKALKPEEQARNDFGSVAAAVRANPRVNFKKVDFAKGEGQKKLQAVERMLSHKRPVLISLCRRVEPEKYVCHVMAVVDSSECELTLLQGLGEDGKPITIPLNKPDFVGLHEMFPFGNDVAFLGDPADS